MKLTGWIRLGSQWKWFVALALVAVGLVACGGGDDDGDGLFGRGTIQASSTLTGDQEAPPVISGAVGTGTLTLASNNAVSGSITLDGMTASAAHIHQGAVGVDGPVIVPLVQTAANTWSVPAGSFLTEDQRNALLAGNLYFNAHNAANPDGEIRGQIGRDVFNVQLTPGQEVPPVTSAASGTGRLVLDPATGNFTATVTETGMASVAAHIHNGAVGVDGPVLFPLTETAPGSGTFVSAPGATMTAAQVALLRAGNLYFNVHSTAFPDGEIRGQIGLLVGNAVMTGAQEVPPTPSTATGTATLVINPLTRAATGTMRVTGMTTTNAHVHLAPPGVAGGIIQPLASSELNLWVVPANAVFSAANVAAFQRGDLYFNAHSAAFPGGEIRGQLR